MNEQTKTDQEKTNMALGERQNTLITRLDRLSEEFDAHMAWHANVADDYPEPKGWMEGAIGAPGEYADSEPTPEPPDDTEESWKNMQFDTDDLTEAVFQAIGAASVTWNTGAGNEIFDDVGAKNIGEALLKWIADHKNVDSEDEEYIRRRQRETVDAVEPILQRYVAEPTSAPDMAPTNTELARDLVVANAKIENLPKAAIIRADNAEKERDEWQQNFIAAEQRATNAAEALREAKDTIKRLTNTNKISMEQRDSARERIDKIAELTHYEYGRA